MQEFQKFRVYSIALMFLFSFDSCGAGFLFGFFEGGLCGTRGGAVGAFAAHAPCQVLLRVSCLLTSQPGGLFSCSPSTSR